MISESKKILAKLLAEESIIVEERAEKEAFFDLENRVLVIPYFKEDVSEDVIDLLIAHECSHAIYTPPKEWYERAVQSKINKTIINVLEDKRVEDMIKSKYPGLRSTFAKGYAELMKMDFFGLSNLDVDEMNVVDKINLYHKVGMIPGIEFSSEEWDFVTKSEHLHNFDQVISLSDELQTYMRKVFSRKFGTNHDDLEVFDIHGDDQFGTSGGVPSGGSPQQAMGNGLPISNIELSPEDNTDETYLESEEFDYEFEDEETRENDYISSKTDVSFSLKQETLYDDSAITSIYVDIPNMETKDLVVDYKTIYSRLKKCCPKVFEDNLINNQYEEFRIENQATVNHLLKEFRLKKNAVIRRKIKEGSSGVINVNKLYAYQFERNIFKKTAKLPREQSHSMIFFLDWSGSMERFIHDTIKNLISLVMFCRKQNIPFEVYAFSSRYFDALDEPNYLTKIEKYKKVPDKNAILIQFRLMNLLSSRMSNVEFIEGCNVLLKTKPKKYDYSFYTSKDACLGHFPDWYTLDATPLNHTILLSRKISEEYKVKTGTDIVNNIFLTDGESHSINFWYNSKLFDISNEAFNIYLRDRRTGMTQKVRSCGLNETNSCLDLVKQSSDIRMFGFRIMDLKEMKSKCYDLFGDFDSATRWNTLRKNNLLRVDNASYDAYYILKPTEQESERGEFELTGKMTVTSISKQFSKMIGKKVENKTFLTSFINFIS